MILLQGQVTEYPFLPIPPPCFWKCDRRNHTAQGALCHPSFWVMWWQPQQILFLGSFNFLALFVQWSFILTIFSIKELKNICSLKVQYRTDLPQHAFSTGAYFFQTSNKAAPSLLSVSKISHLSFLKRTLSKRS